MNRNVVFRYQFVPQGSQVKVLTENNEKKFVFSFKDQEVAFNHTSTVILDVGNCLCDGVFDHHHFEDSYEWSGKKICSAAGLVTQFPSFLNHIKEDSREVTIVIHQLPDFDCFASVYLTQYYLLHRKFPKHYEMLVQYVDDIDTGKLGINPKQIITPYTIALVIGSVVNQSISKDKELQFQIKQQGMKYYYEVLNQHMLEKGLELIRYIFKRLTTLFPQEMSLESPTMFAEGHPFQEECSEIEVDFQKYREDLSDPAVCEKRKLLLPTIKGSEVKEVDGLFWNEIPKSSLHKLWARGDVTSPSGNGYLFTFIPGRQIFINQDKARLIKDRFNYDLSFANRTYIAIDGNSDVCLRGLGKHLELAEQKKEEELFGKDHLDIWRSRGSRREVFTDPWIDNTDPWYDGRDKFYQLIDAPFTGSLLSIEEIKTIVFRFSKPRVENNNSKIIYPFSYAHESFETLCRNLHRCSGIKSISYADEPDRVNYFRPYIQNYMFNTVIDDKENEHYRYEFQYCICNETYIDVECLNGETQSVQLLHEKITEFTINHLYSRLSDVRIHLFKYGIGFLVVNSEVISKENEEVFFEDVVLMNHELCEGFYGKPIISQFFQDKLGINIVDPCEIGLVYADVTFQRSCFSTSMKEELLYKLCTNTKMNVSINKESKHMNNMLGKMFYDMDEQTIYGYSKNGSALLNIFSSNDNMPEQIKKAQNNTCSSRIDKYRTVDWDIFLIVLHQRYCLMHFSGDLSETASVLEAKKISNLRKIMIEFIVQGWFSQITNDEYGMEHYKRWIEIFETEKLHNEVLEQVATLEDFHKRNMDESFNRNFSIISLFFVIISTVTGFFGMNIPLITGDDGAIPNIVATFFTIGAFLFGAIVLKIIWPKIKK